MTGRLKWGLAFLPLAAFVGLVVAFLAQIDEDPSILPSVLLEKPMPAIDLPNLNGAQRLALSDFAAGSPVLLNVFASWCQPCWAEHDVITQLADAGVTVYGLAYKDAPADTRRFLRRLGNPYAEIGVDQSGRAAIELGVYGAPETFIIDGQGIIRHRHVGALTPDIAQQKILPLLKAVES